MYKNKSNENGYVTRNKAHIVAQGYAHIKGVDFNETFVLVFHFEAIRLLISLSCLLRLKLYKLDVKNILFNGCLNEEVYPKQQIDLCLLNHVYKLIKVLYELYIFSHKKLKIKLI